MSFVLRDGTERLTSQVSQQDSCEQCHQRGGQHGRSRSRGVEQSISRAALGGRYQVSDQAFLRLPYTEMLARKNGMRLSSISEEMSLNRMLQRAPRRCAADGVVSFAYCRGEAHRTRRVCSRSPTPPRRRQLSPVAPPAAPLHAH
jgi:hypothetical protein